jgi:hypothetical protein
MNTPTAYQQFASPAGYLGTRALFRLACGLASGRSKRLQVRNYICNILFVPKPNETHLRAWHQIPRSVQKLVELGLAPDNSRFFHPGRIGVAGVCRGMTADDTGQHWTDAIFGMRTNPMTGCTLLENHGAMLGIAAKRGSARRRALTRNGNGRDQSCYQFHRLCLLSRDIDDDWTIAVLDMHKSVGRFQIFI